MKTDTYCSQCGHKESCGQAYSKLGAYRGPSVTWDVIFAFVLPIGVFIAAFAGVQWLLEDHLADKLLIGVGAGVGFAITFVFVIAVRSLRDRLTKKHCIPFRVEESRE